MYKLTSLFFSEDLPENRKKSAKHRKHDKKTGQVKNIFVDNPAHIPCGFCDQLVVYEKRFFLFS
jgi:hypothetical protein